MNPEPYQLSHSEWGTEVFPAFSPKSGMGWEVLYWVSLMHKWVISAVSIGQHFIKWRKILWRKRIKVGYWTYIPTFGSLLSHIKIFNNNLLGTKHIAGHSKEHEVAKEMSPALKNKTSSRECSLVQCLFKKSDEKWKKKKVKLSQDLRLKTSSGVQQFCPPGFITQIVPLVGYLFWLIVFQQKCHILLHFIIAVLTALFLRKYAAFYTLNCLLWFAIRL